MLIDYLLLTNTKQIKVKSIFLKSVSFTLVEPFLHYNFGFISNSQKMFKL